MTVLADATLRERIDAGSIVVEPLAADAIQPSSIDVRLGSRLRVYRHPVMKRVTTDDDWRDMILNGERCWRLEPGHAYLATTFERITVPTDLACQLHGRSSVARLFITPHQQGGWLDAGYSGTPTLEITVTLYVDLAPFDPIGQLVFFELDKPASQPYRGRYQGDSEPTPSKALS
jgi:dCTP deaminase